MVKRTSSAVWQGGLKDGSGKVSTERGVLKDTPYNFSGRFEEGTVGTNPEELVAAAHAGCFSMAFSGQIGERGMTPEKIATTATLTMEKVDGKMTITGIHLDTVATIPNADEAKFQEAANAAKAGCPISRLLSNIEITMSAKLA